MLDVLIGALTFSGSLVAAGKLAGRLPGNPVTSPAGRAATLVLVGVAVLAGLVLLTGRGGTPLLVLLAAAALALGVLLTLPIGGADMPVVISLLNACTGTAVAMAGFVLDSVVLVIAGALVGAAGAILTLLMAEAMNRSLTSILLGGYGTADTAEAIAATGQRARDLRRRRRSAARVRVQGGRRARLRAGGRAGAARARRAVRGARGRRRRGQLRHPPRRRPDARAT